MIGLFAEDVKARKKKNAKARGAGSAKPSSVTNVVPSNSLLCAVTQGQAADAPLINPQTDSLSNLAASSKPSALSRRKPLQNRSNTLTSHRNNLPGDSLLARACLVKSPRKRSRQRESEKQTNDVLVSFDQLSIQVKDGSKKKGAAQVTNDSLLDLQDMPPPKPRTAKTRLKHTDRSEGVGDVIQKGFEKETTSSSLEVQPPVPNGLSIFVVPATDHANFDEDVSPLSDGIPGSSVNKKSTIDYSSAGLPATPEFCDTPTREPPAPIPFSTNQTPSPEMQGEQDPFSHIRKRNGQQTDLLHGTSPLYSTRDASPTVQLFQRPPTNGNAATSVAQAGHPDGRKRRVKLSSPSASLVLANAEGQIRLTPSAQVPKRRDLKPTPDRILEILHMARSQPKESPTQTAIRSQQSLQRVILLPPKPNHVSEDARIKPGSKPSAQVAKRNDRKKAMGRGASFIGGQPPGRHVDEKSADNLPGRHRIEFDYRYNDSCENDLPSHGSVLDHSKNPKDSMAIAVVASSATLPPKAENVFRRNFDDDSQFEDAEEDVDVTLDFKAKSPVQIDQEVTNAVCTTKQGLSDEKSTKIVLRSKSVVSDPTNEDIANQNVLLDAPLVEAKLSSPKQRVPQRKHVKKPVRKVKNDSVVETFTYKSTSSTTKQMGGRRSRRERAQPLRLGQFASETEIDRRINKKKKNTSKRDNSSRHADAKSKPFERQRNSRQLSLSPKTFTAKTEISKLTAPAVVKKVESNSDQPSSKLSRDDQKPTKLRSLASLLHKESDHELSFSDHHSTSDPVGDDFFDEMECGEEPQEETNVSRGQQWSDKELECLKIAHGKVTPTRSSFWREVASLVPNRTEEECRTKWFSLFNTPAVKKRPARKVPEPSSCYDEDDFFDATPFRKEPLADVSASLQKMDLGSAIKVDSEEVCGNMFARLAMDSDPLEDSHEHPSFYVPKTSRAHVLNLKKEMSKAVAAKKKKDKRNRNKPPKKVKEPRMPHFFSSQDECDIRARVDDDGVVEVEMPDHEEDDFFDSMEEHEED